uniref:Uncharacterized protein n=1 Tax=Arion vulgaris TaxID=1028688 RepID=A0A0B6YAL2_9EUPU
MLDKMLKVGNQHQFEAVKQPINTDLKKREQILQAYKVQNMNINILLLIDSVLSSQ